LPRKLFSYVLGRAVASVFLLLLMFSVFLLEVVPLELQRRIINNLVKVRPHSWIVGLCAVYAAPCSSRAGPSLRSTSIAAGSAATRGHNPKPVLRPVARHGVPMMPAPLSE
jgi:hypothetical protein